MNVVATTLTTMDYIYMFSQYNSWIVVQKYTTICMAYTMSKLLILLFATRTRKVITVECLHGSAAGKRIGGSIEQLGEGERLFVCACIPIMYGMLVNFNKTIVYFLIILCTILQYYLFLAAMASVHQSSNSRSVCHAM